MTRFLIVITALALPACVGTRLVEPTRLSQPAPRDWNSSMEKKLDCMDRGDQEC